MDNKHFFLIVFLIVVISGSSVYAETFGYGKTESIPINYSNIVINETSNQSEYWNTNLGSLGNVNATQFENNGGTLSILNSWLTSFFNLLFGGKTTDDLTEGSTNLYDNQSWNESHADGKYIPYTGATQDVDLGSNNLTTTDTIQSKISKLVYDSSHYSTIQTKSNGYLYLNPSGDRKSVV